MNRTSAEMWAWIIERVTGSRPIIKEVKKQPPPVGNQPTGPLPSDFRVDTSGLTDHEREVVHGLVQRGYTKEQIAQALLDQRQRR
jgi:hypothetical protein